MPIIWRRELLGGVLTGLLGLAECMSYGAIAFAALGPQYAAGAVLAGVYAYIIVNLVSAPLAGTRTLIASPLPTLAVALGSAIGILQEKHGASLGDPQVVLFFIVFCAGLLQMLYGAIRLGDLAKYIPQPVVAGLMNGAALSIIFSQLPALLGISKGTHLWEFSQWQPAAVGLAIFIIAGTMFLTRFIRNIPAPLTGMILGTLVYVMLHELLPDLALGDPIGRIDTELPIPHFAGDFLRLLLNGDPTILLYDILPLAAGLAVISCIPTLVVTVAADNVVEKRSNSSKELVALGFANMFSATFGSIAAAGSMSRSAMNLRCGARTGWSRVFSGLTVLCLLLIFGHTIEHFPKVAFAAALIVGGLQIFDRASIRLLVNICFRRGSPSIGDAVVILAVTGTLVLVGVFQSLALGIFIALAQFIVRMSRDPIRRTYTAERVRSNVDRVVAELSVLEQAGHRIRVFELEGTLFFGTADKVANTVYALRGSADYLILDLKRVTDIDSTGGKILVQLWHRLAKNGDHIAFSGLNHDKGHTPLKTLTEQEPAIAQLSFAGLDDALAWAEDEVLDQLVGDTRYDREIEHDEVQVLYGMTHEEIFQLSRFLAREEFADGDIIFRQGDPGDRVFLILRGRVDVFVAYDQAQRKRISTLCPGTILGEIAILDHRPRGATTRARGVVVCYSLSHESLRDLTAEFPSVGVQFATGLGRELAKRIRIMNAVAAELQN